MNKVSIASVGTVSVACDKCGQVIQKEAGKQRLGRIITHSQEPRELPMPPVSISGVPPTHQRRWSADLSKGGSPRVITVKKNRKEPQPPERRGSLLKPHAASDSESKRYSCPPMGIASSPSSSSSSSSSTTSSCSSPPPIQTSLITGHDPLGWKMRPKSSSTTAAQARRLSLQIPIPVVFPHHNSSPVPHSTPDNSLNRDPSPKIKPPLGANLSRRHHSDSSAFLRSLATPLPVVTLEELCGVHLCSVRHSDSPDDVFGESKGTRQQKIPPPVPEKTSMARQIAQLMADSAQHGAPVTKTTAEDINSRVNPESKHSETERHPPTSGKSS